MKINFPIAWEITKSVYSCAVLLCIFPFVLIYAIIKTLIEKINLRYESKINKHGNTR